MTIAERINVLRNKMANAASTRIIFQPPTRISANILPNTIRPASLFPALPALRAPYWLQKTRPFYGLTAGIFYKLKKN